MALRFPGIPRRLRLSASAVGLLSLIAAQPLLADNNQSQTPASPDTGEKWRGSDHHSYGISHGDHKPYGITGRPENKLRPGPQQEPGGIKGHRSFGYTEPDRRPPPRHGSIPHSAYRYPHNDTRIIYAPGYHRNQPSINQAPAISGYRNSAPGPAYNSQINPWSALADYQIDSAKAGFRARLQQQPNSALSRVGLSLSTALGGDLDAGLFTMEEALQADVAELDYFSPGAGLLNVIEELLIAYNGEPLMTAALHYLRRDYRAAERAVEVAANYCQACQPVYQLERLIQRRR